jgi:hypothetical protein
MNSVHQKLDTKKIKQQNHHYIGIITIPNHYIAIVAIDCLVDVTPTGK